MRATVIVASFAGARALTQQASPPSRSEALNGIVVTAQGRGARPAYDPAWIGHADGEAR